MAGSLSKMYFCQHSSFTTSSTGKVPNYLPVINKLIFIIKHKFTYR